MQRTTYITSKNQLNMEVTKAIVVLHFVVEGTQQLFNTTEKPKDSVYDAIVPIRENILFKISSWHSVRDDEDCTPANLA